MTSEADYFALLEQHRRLRLAAQRVVEAANYPTAEDEEPRLYRRQLADLERELAGEPQPTSIWTRP